LTSFILAPFRAFFMALGMFSIIPVPKNSWSDKYLRFMMPLLPIVGVIFGFLWYGAAYLLSISIVPPILQSAAVTLIPFILSGFLHLDGFIDTSDAVLSRRNLEEKRRILKDSHLGAFGAVMLCCLFLLQFCATYVIVTENKQLETLIFIPAVSRIVSGFMMLKLKPMSEGSYASAYRTGVKFRHTLMILFELCLVGFASYWFFGAKMLITLGVMLGVGVFTAVHLHRQFKGFSGDLCGCVITISELAGLLCLATIL